MKCKLSLFFDLTAGLRHRTARTAARRLPGVAGAAFAAAAALPGMFQPADQFAHDASDGQRNGQSD